jgi:hypothetical protein
VYNQKVLYRNKADSTKTIKLQRLYGFLGSVDYRIVQTKPFLYLWNEVEFVDTATINKSEWIYVNEKL